MPRKLRFDPTKREHLERYDLGNREFFEVWIEGTLVYTRSNVMTVDDQGHRREAAGGEAWSVVDGHTPEQAFVLRTRAVIAALGTDARHAYPATVHAGAKLFPIARSRPGLVRVTLDDDRFWEIWTQGKRVITRTGGAATRAGETVTIIDCVYPEVGVRLRDEILTKRGLAPAQKRRRR